MNGLVHIGSFAVDSGQAIIGDPCYLREWDTNVNDKWDIADSVGKYSYHGASSTTLKNGSGELGDMSAVAFSTGYGDGIYPVYATYKDGVIATIVVDFLGELDDE